MVRCRQCKGLTLNHNKSLTFYRFPKHSFLFRMMCVNFINCQRKPLPRKYNFSRWHLCDYCFLKDKNSWKEISAIFLTSLLKPARCFFFTGNIFLWYGRIQEQNNFFSNYRMELNKRIKKIQSPKDQNLRVSWILELVLLLCFFVFWHYANTVMKHIIWTV